MVHPHRLLLRTNAFLIAGTLMLFAAAALRMEAYDLSINRVHNPNTPGTEADIKILNQEEFDALVELARTGLVLGTLVSVSAVTAKLFVPATYPPFVDVSQRGV